MITASTQGSAAALAGPAFLIAYYAYHGIGIGLGDSIVFFGVSYLAPAAVFLIAGCAIGQLLSPMLPNLSGPAARIISTVAAATLLLAGIAFLLTDTLNFGIGFGTFTFPAFSVVCGTATTMASSTYLGFTYQNDAWVQT